MKGKLSSTSIMCKTQTKLVAHFTKGSHEDVRCLRAGDVDFRAYGSPSSYTSYRDAYSRSYGDLEMGHLVLKFSC